MSLQDFDRCTPLEFEKIFEIWHENQQAAVRISWEQTRQLAVCMLQPWAKKTLKETDVMQFPWDEPEAKKKPRRKKTRAELEAERQHYEDVKKARGLI